MKPAPTLGFRVNQYVFFLSENQAERLPAHIHLYGDNAAETGFATTVRYQTGASDPI